MHVFIDPVTDGSKACFVAEYLYQYKWKILTEI
uniref:Uncharacterized protein n=1 Tax=Anguilla anguilla TaxID=7936 RepID=A0A0E9TGR7_ANGAN